MPVVTVGGIHVVSQGADAKRINAELQRLDRALFLDFENVPPYGLVAIVKEHLGSAVRPLEVLVWQEPDGRPKPLCMALVDEVKRQASTRGMNAVKKAAAANRARKDKVHQQAQAAMDDIHDEHADRMRAAELDSLPPFWRPRNFGKK